MEVILLKDVDSLGKEGDVLNVKDGYARNFLIPQKLAAAASPDMLNMVESKKKKKVKQEEKRKQEAQGVAKKIADSSFTIAVEAGVEDKIFGTVTAEMIKNTLRQEGVEVDKRDIVMEEPIKKLGVYQIPVKLHPDVIAELRVWIVKK